MPILVLTKLGKYKPPVKSPFLNQRRITLQGIEINSFYHFGLFRFHLCSAFQVPSPVQATVKIATIRQKRRSHRLPVWVYTFVGIYGTAVYLKYSPLTHMNKGYSSNRYPQTFTGTICQWQRTVWRVCSPGLTADAQRRIPTE